MATRNITRLNGEFIARRFISTGRRPDGIKVINKTGSLIGQDKIVAISGYDTTSGLLKVVLADPTATAHADLWVTAAPIANNTADFIVKGGLSLANLDTSSFANVGDPVYLSNTVGGFSASPASPGATIQIGFVRVKSSTVGQIVWDFLPTAVNINATGSGVLTASGTITSANITGTSAGQLGHAQGVVLVPAGGTHIVNELVYCVMINAFSVAAYTGGGNLSVNIGTGGAALTGVAATGSFITLGANGIIEFVPLAATFNTYTENKSLNLVSTVAPTNPGTAAGVFRYIVGYRQIATGL